eukprot:1556237-Pyramimonas_sp.AAC.1
MGAIDVQAGPSFRSGTTNFTRPAPRRPRNSRPSSRCTSAKETVNWSPTDPRGSHRGLGSTSGISTGCWPKTGVQSRPVQGARYRRESWRPWPTSPSRRQRRRSPWSCWHERTEDALERAKHAVATAAET